MNKLKIIAIIVNFSIGLLLLGSAGVIFFFSTFRDGVYIDIGSQPHWKITSDVLQENLRASLPIPKDRMILMVDTLDMKLPVDLNLKLILIAMMLVVSGYMVWVLFLIRGIVIDVMQGDAFKTASISRVKRIGIFVLLAPVVEWLLHQVLMFWIAGKFHLDGVKLAAESNLGWPVILLGLLVIVLAVALEQAQQIKEENELTI